ncbi:MAG: hypothetical protein PHC88_12795 [Terrimicrobiaceae bacterium]|nr:hypothetical protein [Terrimicrobiaceae bacterium]
MKRWLPLVVFLLAVAISLRAETAQQVYARGVRAYVGGNTDAARRLFQEVLSADPGNKPAAIYLRRIDAEKPPNADLHKQMDALIVPKVDFRDASLSTVLDYLPKVAAEQSGGKLALNIVRMFPSEYGRDKTLTLQLAGAPMSNVLDYVAQLTGLKIEYQAHAVVLSLARPAAAAPTPQ